MREQYYSFIKENEIQDTLSWVEDMSYTKKLQIIQELLKVYSKSVVNISLAQYEDRYIKAHRVVSYMTRNILVNLCKMIQSKECK